MGAEEHLAAVVTEFVLVLFLHINNGAFTCDQGSRVGNDQREILIPRDGDITQGLGGLQRHPANGTETEKVLDHARAKLASKGCDWIVANDVSAATGVMGGDRNKVHVVRDGGQVSWPDMSKMQVADALIGAIVAELAKKKTAPPEKERAKKARGK
ncbi:MAG: hypothetical protein KC994_14275 [Candidatus Omnitrophica bacterium]|nr:hypothetical protein [Candidatus Omnitrophota bacterium]